jgi:hypothetical protein
MSKARGECGAAGLRRPGMRHVAMYAYICLHFDMSEQRRSDRKRTQTQLSGHRGWKGQERQGRTRPGELTKPPLPARMTAWVGLCSSTRWGAAGSESGLARTAWPGPDSNDRKDAAAAAHAAHRDQAVEQVYERFETACDDLDSGLFHLDLPHCYCCMQCFAGARWTATSCVARAW